ncbi:MAG: response regulator, partial [Bacteroidales bacterium]|nr:response regulator [Bacteroidales bacterium]
MNTTKQIRIMIAEDHELYLDALLKIINKNSSIEVVATASNGADLIEKLKTNIVDLVLLD